ncbi:hypothetical protein HPP92_014684 [Vanilla planifolia]|nr:hypothetical protein HPP92_014684 [Vanilla planifolia]
MNAEESSMTKDMSLQIPQSLAVQIEAELFKLFGGVNKKYKEKGRSLLFNLKDPSNPELRERVLSGDLPPGRLCSMTAEELASKELSQWRQAKAEELAQMVVLPDMDMDIRRVVKKTHKGEFQVELEQDDSAHVEVGLWSDVPLKKPLKANKESQNQPRSKGKGKALSKGLNTSEGFLPGEKSDMDKRNLSGSLDPILPDKADYMQDLMEEDLKDSELLPPVVSLDEFMQALDSEPPFENLDVNASQSNLSPNERSLISPHSANRNTLDNPGHRMDSGSDNSRTKLASESSLNSRLRVSDIREDGKGNSELINSKADEYREGGDELKSDTTDVKQAPTVLDSSAKRNKMWEGVLQLNVSALSSVVSFFLSGEKTSMEEWPNMLEVKGRVRLDAFEKFVQALPLSRSRAIMVLEVSWKEGSVDSGRLHLAEAINSYITDERLGLAEPAPGVELYLCPSHPKLIGMLEKHLPKDHIESISSIVKGLIGIVVWRRPNVINSPRVHGKHSSSKKHTSSRKHRLSVAPNASKPQPEDDDDVPPGFGPPISREDDDLPEFDFTHGGSKPRHHSAKLGRPADHMRELVLKYGQGGGQDQSLGITVQPWNDDDDIPEWQPNNDLKPPAQPIAPPPPVPTQLQAYPQQQQTVQSFVINQQLISPQQQQHMLQPNSSQFLQMPPIQPQVGGLHSMTLQNVPSQPGVAWWPASRGHQDGGVQLGGLLQPCHVGGN